MYSGFEIVRKHTNYYEMRFTEDNIHSRIDLNTTTIGMYAYDLVKFTQELESLHKFKDTELLYIKSTPFSDKLTIRFSHENLKNSIACDHFNLLNLEENISNGCEECTACKNIKDFYILFSYKNFSFSLSLYGNQLTNIIKQLKITISRLNN